MENIICKCGSPVKSHTGLFAHIVRYCDACWDYYHVEDKNCNHNDYSVVKVAMKDGRLALRKQCDDCGDYCDSQFLKMHEFDLDLLRNGEDNNALYHKRRKESSDYAYKLLYQRYLTKRKTIFFEKYNIYLKSEKWQNKRQLVFKRDLYTCQCCFLKPAEQVHHLNYTHVFNEPIFDLVSVCGDCHKQIHNEKDLFKAVANATAVVVKFGT